jgi:hypothetical protein
MDTIQPIHANIMKKADWRDKPPDLACHYAQHLQVVWHSTCELTYPGKPAYSRMILGNQKGSARHRSLQALKQAAQNRLRELRQRARSAIQK